MNFGSTGEFKILAEFIKNNFGVDLFAKQVLVEGRLQGIIKSKGMKSFKEYVAYVISDKTGLAVSELMDRVTTNHTFFMREAEHFDFFYKEVLPYLYKKEKSSKDLRIWSAGCSSGEEPYTLEMLVMDYLGDESGLWDKKVLATDLSKKVLDIAIKGEYANESLENVPERWRKQYFVKINSDMSSVCDSIKKEIIFRRFNLMEENFPFRKKFHVIYCRNVMIYFDGPTKLKLIRRFYDATEIGGFLFIGHSESLGTENAGYKYIMPSVYRK